MQCERCGRQTDIIKHIGIHEDIKFTFSFNGSREAMICIPCWNNKPEMKICHEIEEIRND
jgi:hypothetical protein